MAHGLAVAQVPEGTLIHAQVLDAQTSQVQVAINIAAPSNFIHLLGLTPPRIEVAALAEAAASGMDGCVLVLDPAAQSALSLDSNARLDSPDCAVQVNSTSGSAATAASNSRLAARSTRLVGGYQGGAEHFAPTPLTRQPVVADPLARVRPPSVGGCDYVNLEIDSVTRTLRPGVYCGGLSIRNNAVVRFDPGVYVIRDGRFFVDSNSAVDGEGVGFYLTGAASTLLFDSNLSLDFTAPATGPMTGILFFEDRAAPLGRDHEVFSNTVARLEGAIYLPRGHLVFDSNSEVAAASAFTTLIVCRLSVDSNTRLAINANYADARTPVVGVAIEKHPRLIR